jgi:pimeloyl-ACP methyl ester carboxylesterase
MEQLISMIPDARGVTVAGAGHRIAQDVPERFAALLDDFLSRLS